ncbi:hypothetical protein GGU10DRAFT_386335 [Lentinula aff. detonsa]|uniref:Uncharacterized protein n=1 Tax=Lentinula aff. detonsa TaxID=2804958 RepID=A0AA38NPV1_9AGAR|nr:hypothetical protein GGU10DRAFT_386335 [Lentinula aff. detonsa]
MEFSSTGDRYPEVIQRLRKFRVSDEPEKKHLFHSFIEFRAPHKPPAELGKPGDVFLNHNAFKLYMKENIRWARWDATPDARLQHPEYSHRYLWVIQISGQRAIDFVPLTLLRKFKIIDAVNVLKSIASSHRKENLSQISLNTRKGKKGRLSNIEPPTCSSSIDVQSAMPPGSISAPIQQSISTSSPSSPTPLQTPGASSSQLSSRVERIISDSVPRQIERDRQLLERNELLEKENQELRMILRISKESAEDCQAAQASSTVESIGQEKFVDRISSVNGNDAHQPQLQSPPPTPSIYGQLSSDFVKPVMDVFPSKQLELPPVNMRVEGSGSDFAAMDMDQDKKPSVHPKSEPGQTTQDRAYSTPKYIDLTLSDDDSPSTNSQSMRKSLHAVSYRPYEVPRLQPTLNLKKNIEASRQKKKPNIHSALSHPASLCQVTPSPCSDENKIRTPIHCSSATLGTSGTASSNRISQCTHTFEQLPIPPIERSIAPVTPQERRALSSTTSDPSVDDNDILEITPDQFRAGVKAGKRKAIASETVVSSSGMQSTFQNNAQGLDQIGARPVLVSMTKKEVPQDDFVQITEATYYEIDVAAAANALRGHSVQGCEPPLDDDTMVEGDELFDLTYPEDEPCFPFTPPSVQDVDIKMEHVDVVVQNKQLVQEKSDVVMGDVDMEQDAPKVEKELEDQQIDSANFGLTFDIIRVLFRGKKEFKKCNLCRALNAKERKVKFPIDDPHSMLCHLASHQDKKCEIETLQHIINRDGLDSEQLRPYLED